MADNQPAATPAVAAAAKVKNPSVEAGINAITSPAAEKSYYEGVQKKQDALSASQTEGLKKFGARMGDVESAQKAELSAMPKVEAPKETKFDHKGASELSSLMLVFGALAGRKTATPLTAALGNMAAAMEGHVAGDAERFERESKQFKENFDLGMKNYENYIKGQQAIIEKHNGDRANIEREQKQFALENGVSAEMIANSVTNHKDYLNTLYKAEDGRMKAMDHAANISEHAERIIKLRRENQAVSSGGFDDETKAFWTKVLQSGGQLPSGLARTPAGKQLVSEVMTGVGHGDVSPEKILSNQAAFAGEKAGQRTVGVRAANIAVSGIEAYKFADLASVASKNVPRGKFVPANSLLQIGERNWSPEQADFVVANQSLINAYASAVSRSGSKTVHDTQKAEEMLNTAYSHEMYQAAVDQVKKELAVLSEAPQEASKSFSLKEKRNESERKVFSSKLDLESAIKSGQIRSGDTFYDPDGNPHKVK